ncbi:DUF3052 domain-containing protein [Marinoscillum sp.]|uniref:DUF3052 domain-containing protein n=1 Tax=Marinoscillum sp. TaxID=2024838 RepID=UPI003BAB5093
MTTGYSGTPLLKKLGIKPGNRCYLYQVPEHYFDLLFNIPENTEFDDGKVNGPYDFIHAFVSFRSDLESIWPTLKAALKKEGMIWISWPKGSSKLPKDINENDIRAHGLHHGLVDVKVCAVDHDWSGLKFMYRRKDR